jgi:hypothetical protein
VQERLAQIAFILNFLLPMFPAQRQNLRQHTTEIVPMLVIVRQVVHNSRKLSYALVQKNLTGFCTQKIRIPTCR